MAPKSFFFLHGRLGNKNTQKGPRAPSPTNAKKQGCFDEAPDGFGMVQRRNGTSEDGVERTGHKLRWASKTPSLEKGVNPT